MAKPYVFVSCDIVGHSAEREVRAQVARVEAINAMVRGVIRAAKPGSVFWASGGDGGHLGIGLDEPEYKALTIGLIVELRKWSVGEKLRLRISAHVGEVEETEGADGRVQPVGPGVNLAGRLLEYGDQNRVVVSGPFRELFQSAEPPVGRFHSAKMVRPRDFDILTIWLVSVNGEFESGWLGVDVDEPSMIAESFREARSWDVVFYARRMMEVNAGDPLAIHYLSLMDREAFTYEDTFHKRRRINPLLGSLDASSRLDLIGATQLVERRPGETLCRLGDQGDSMFIILRGEVGVVLASRQPNAPEPARPVAVLTSGAIVGELAFALKRRRTATLQCLSPTVLLAINSDLYDETVERSSSKETLRRTMKRFLLERILEHVCKNSVIFVGKDRSGPLSELPAPWEALVEHSSFIPLPWKASAVISRRLATFKAKGLYILVCGELEEQGVKPNVLVEQDLPILYADLEGLSLPSKATYIARTDATVLHVREEGFRNRLVTDDVYRKLIAAIAASLRKTAKAPSREPSASGKPRRLKVLYLASNPFNTPTLQLGLETREIESKIRMSEHRNALEFIPKLAVRPDDLQQALLVEQPNVVHFSGHGTATGGLILEDSDRKKLVVYSEAILTLFTALPDNLRGVLFNACDSEELAQALVGVVDFAIGMKGEIEDEAAILFASAFYRAIGFGKSVRAAFDLGLVAIQMSKVWNSASSPQLFVRQGKNASSLILINPDE